MKRISVKSPSPSVPRLDSLLHRLKHAPGKKDASYLDQLMIFLDDPPPGVSDRWKEGAKMCSDWGIPCSGAAVWRLYRSYALQWRWQLADEDGSIGGESPEVTAEKMSKLVALRTFEILANPQSPPASVLGLARLELRKQALDLARQKQDDNHAEKVELALKALDERVIFNWDATFALKKLKEALQKKQASPLPPAFGNLPPSLADPFQPSSK